MRAWVDDDVEIYHDQAPDRTRVVVEPEAKSKVVLYDPQGVPLVESRRRAGFVR